MSSDNTPIDRSVFQQIKKEEQLSIDVISSTLLTTIQNESVHNRLSNSTIDQLIKLSQAEDTDPQTKLELLELAFANRPQGKRLVKLLEQAKTDINHS
jgi:lipase chaperone LimK